MTTKKGDVHRKCRFSWEQKGASIQRGFWKNRELLREGTFGGWQRNTHGSWSESEGSGTLCRKSFTEEKRERERVRECVRRRNWNPNFQDLLIVTRLSKVRKGPWNYQGLFVCLFFLKWEHPKFWSLVWNLTWVLYPCSSP